MRALVLSLAVLGAASGGLRLGPADPRTVEIVDDEGQTVATATVRADEPLELQLPPGRYALDHGEPTPAEVVVVDGETAIIRLPGHREPSELKPAPPAMSREDPPAHLDASTVLAVPDVPAVPAVEEPPPPRWTRWGSPLLSALIPGVGQMVNRQPLKGVAILAGTAGLVTGAVLVGQAGSPRDGAARDPERSDAAEIARLSSLAALSSGAALLYIGQILDAHAIARGRPASPYREHRVQLSFARFSVVGQRAGTPRYALYDDFTFSVLGQVHPRVSLGVSDLTFKVGPHGEFTVQLGARASYRIVGSRRLWLLGAGGILLQGTRRPASTDPDRSAASAFGSAAYVQLELQWFLLDRWALGVAPRVSLPFTDRTYGRGRQIPQWSTTFELGASLGVYL